MLREMSVQLQIEEMSGVSSVVIGRDSVQLTCLHCRQVTGVIRNFLCWSDTVRYNQSPKPPAYQDESEV